MIEVPFKRGRRPPKITRGPFINFFRSDWTIWTGWGVYSDGCLCQCHALSIVLWPGAWRIGSYHAYYDGCNCSWMFGPFRFERNGTWGCKSCLRDISL